MLLAIDYLNWYGQGPPRGPWARPAILAPLTFAPAALDRLTLYFSDIDGDKATSFLRTPRATPDAAAQVYAIAAQSVSDLVLTALARSKRDLVAGAPAPVAPGPTATWARARYRMGLTFTPQPAGAVEQVILPGPRLMYTVTDGQGTVALNTADPDVQVFLAAARAVMVTNHGEPVTGLTDGLLLT